MNKPLPAVLWWGKFLGWTLMILAVIATLGWMVLAIARIAGGFSL